MPEARDSQGADAGSARVRFACAFVPAALALVAVWLAAGAGPEPDQWREWYGQSAIVHDPASALDFSGQANHLVGRAVLLGGTSLGLDYPVLAFVPWLLLVVALLGFLRARHAGRPISAPWILVISCALFSPRFGASGFVFERVSSILPLLFALVALRVLGRRRHRRTPALGLAFLIAAAAIFTSAAGTLLWLGLLPLVVHCARRSDRHAFPLVALWVILGQCFVWLCWDEVRADAGLLGSLVDDPWRAWRGFALVLSSSLPDPLPAAQAHRSIVALALTAGLVATSLWAWLRREAEALPWISMGWVGLFGAASIAHAQMPHYLQGITAKETAQLVLLAPLGLGAALAILLPASWRKASAFLAGLFFLLVAQNAWRGLETLRFESDLLHKSEALMRFAELDESLYLGVAPLSSVRSRDDRRVLRARGLLRRLPPVPSKRLDEAGFTMDAELGRGGSALDVGDVATCTGAVVEDALLVLIVRRRDDAAEIVQVVVPVIAGGGLARFRCDVAARGEWRAGDRVEAYALQRGGSRLVRLRGGRSVVADGAELRFENLPGPGR